MVIRSSFKVYIILCGKEKIFGKLAGASKVELTELEG